MTHTARHRSTPVQPDPIRIQNPNDILEIVPYLLGFHPTDSLVLVGITDGTTALWGPGRLELAATSCSVRLPAHPFVRSLP